MNQTNKKSILVRELYEYFLSQNFQIVSAIDVEGIRYPKPLINDGYGDQENKMPEILAYDPKENCFIIGATRTSKDELASEESLTEYNVFLDQKDAATNTPYRLYVNVPATLVNEFHSLVREYIHREYWHKIVVIGSSKIDE
jgi:hypothetical protein